MGLGVALGRRPLVDRDLATNALIEASPHTITAATVYWLVSADHTTQRPDLLGFRQWLLEEAEHFEDDPATHTAQDQTEPDDR